MLWGNRIGDEIRAHHTNLREGEVGPQVSGVQRRKVHCDETNSEGRWVNYVQCVIPLTHGLLQNELTLIEEVRQE